jgi:hypothetical protein
LEMFDGSKSLETFLAKFNKYAAGENETNYFT